MVTVGSAVMRDAYNPATNQYSISGGGQQSFPVGFESSMNYGELGKKYPQIKGSFEAPRPQPSQKQSIVSAHMVTPTATSPSDFTSSPGFDS